MPPFQGSYIECPDINCFYNNFSPSGFYPILSGIFLILVFSHHVTSNLQLPTSNLQLPLNLYPYHETADY